MHKNNRQTLSSLTLLTSACSAHLQFLEIPIVKTNLFVYKSEASIAMMMSHDQEIQSYVIPNAFLNAFLQCTALRCTIYTENLKIPSLKLKLIHAQFLYIWLNKRERAGIYTSGYGVLDLRVNSSYLKQTKI